jgi:PAS domain S-box-containing protein
MCTESHTEGAALRGALRDLVALSTIPAAWVGREPPVIAAGLADVLVGSLHLDFAFVRLCDPQGDGAIEETRGEAWKAFPEWLQTHLGVGQISRKEIITDLGGAQPCRGVVIPIGVNSEGGLVAAASTRTDFPSEIDQMLLSVAANHAAAAFQNARLRAELDAKVAELSQARNELEMKVEERAADLQRSEAYLGEAQRLTHTGSWACNFGTREIRHSSEEHSRLYGFDPEKEMPSFEEFVQRMHPEDRPRVVEMAERSNRTGKDFEAHFRIVLPDGTTKYVHGVGHPVFKPSGDVGDFVGILMDVTERRRAEQATRLLAAVVESSHDAIVSKNLDGVITSWNKGAERLFGYTAEEAVGQNITLIIPPDRRDEERTIVERLTRAERVDHFDTVRMRKDGSLLDVVLTISPIKDAADRVVGASKLARDITERKRAEEALRQAQADLAHINRLATMGELTASLAHEIRQPISAAVTNAKTCLRWLGRDAPDVAEAREAASRLVKDATRASDIIGKIGLLFKKDAMQRELVDVNELVREMIVLLRSEANRYSISIHTELTEDLPKVMADRVQLQQVFMNLMLNGIEAMKEMADGSELTIKSAAADGLLVISVSDTGVGLPPEQAEQIFRAFFTTKDNGTGMGLPISRSIIESHGGRLWATANSGRGATFQFSLPARAAAHA